MPLFLQYILIGLGSIIVFAYGYGQWMQGWNKRKIDSISILEADVEALRGKVEELTKEVHALREENTAERRKFTEAILSIQGRDPQMQTFMKMLEEYASAGRPVINAISLEVMPVIKKLDKFLDKQDVSY